MNWPKFILFFFSSILLHFFWNSQGSLSSTAIDNLLGEQVDLKSKWIGTKPVSREISILILAGHADSQGIAGAGTAGESVDIKGLSSMNPLISDELFWNLKICDAVVKLGRKKGLNINSYIPKIRNIDDANNPITNWSKGAQHVRNGGYAFEIHFDSYREYGFGSGLIPALTSKHNLIDESFAQSFGRYPLFFRGGLGAPRRGIRLLEIAKLEGELEANLRDPDTSEKTIDFIAKKVVKALENGLLKKI